MGPVRLLSEERPRVGLRSREWTAVGATEVEVVREMGRFLREIGEGTALRYASLESPPTLD